MRLRFIFHAPRVQGNILLVLMSVLSILADAQAPPKKIKEFPTGEVSRVALDRLGDLYLVVKGAVIRKYDTDGNFMGEYSDPGLPMVTLLEPWNPLRIFIYSMEKQEITLLDHNMELLQKMKVDSAWAIEPSLASTSIENNFWILDKSDASLKRVDPRTKAVSFEVKIVSPHKDPEFIYVREYQNLIFLVDRKSGIVVLNSIGKQVHKVDAINLEYIGFLGEEFYYLDNHKLKFFDLYTEERREVSVDPDARFVLVTDERMILIKKDKVEVWEFKP